MRGVTMRTPERVELAEELRADGMTLREIADLLGVAVQTVHTWLNDPDRSKAKARRLTYGGTCVDCGKPTDGSGGIGRGRQRCADCRVAYMRTMEYREEQSQRTAGMGRKYTDDDIIRHMRAAAVDGVLTGGIYEANRAPDSPSKPTIMLRFGKWNECVERAGLTPGNAPHDHYTRLSMDELAECMATAIREYGGPLTVKQYEALAAERDDLLLASPALIRQRFGLSWPAALRAGMERL
jgi:hypothetical protein